MIDALQPKRGRPSKDDPRYVPPAEPTESVRYRLTKTQKALVDTFVRSLKASAPKS